MFIHQAKENRIQIDNIVVQQEEQEKENTLNKIGICQMYANVCYKDDDIMFYDIDNEYFEEITIDINNDDDNNKEEELI
ncbi:unnamed protein product [Rotaria magnacalcarata]|uniref:Uncharacterized protein n=1 Tax=Rotaria magnacalcarata TaxID=392030 RepID=A0A8S2PZF6_9BILA|nr:unnamed protein product [Rotaria magnacalcarata]